MKICLVVSSLSGGGAERIVVNLANYYSSKGYDVSLVVFNAVGPYMDQINAGVSLIDLGSRTRSVFWKLFWTMRNIRPRLYYRLKEIRISLPAFWHIFIMLVSCFERRIHLS